MSWIGSLQASNLITDRKYKTRLKLSKQKSVTLISRKNDHFSTKIMLVNLQRQNPIRTFWNEKATVYCIVNDPINA